MIREQVDEIIKELPSHYDDLDFLSKAAVKLSTLLYNLGDDLAEAHLREHQVVVKYLSEIPVEGKRMAVSEAELRGMVETNNEYEKKKLHYQSTVEFINTIKKRLDSQNQKMKAGI